MQIIVISPGSKPSGAEKEFLDDYAKRIGRSFKFELVTSDVSASKLVESDFVVVLDEKGVKLDNLTFSRRFEDVTNSGRYKRVVFVIGGAYGVSEDFRARADLIWSFSEQVFPHKLFRIMLTEQIYRTIEILNGSPYHHI
jgi:23S rRNA (pseudouridine1915-N3)-methyltransferase